MSASAFERLRCWIGGSSGRGPAVGAAGAAGWAARGERALLAGEDRRAGECLARATALDPAYPWTYAYRAALHFRAGRPRDAARDADRLARLDSGGGGFVIRSILAEQQGRADLAQEWLDRALARRREAWLYALRGALHGRSGRVADALADLGRARLKSPPPWLVLQKADVLRKQGLWKRAFRLLKDNEARLSGSADVARRAASLCLDQGEYAQAAAFLGRALRLSPGDLELRAERAKVFFVAGRSTAALRELERACADFPSDARLNLRRRQLQVLCGKRPAAFGPLPPGGRQFLRGCLSFRARRPARAARLFSAALAAAPDDRWLAERASFYRCAARALAASAPVAPPRGPELVLLGLGMRQPFQMTLESLRLLDACDVVYNYIPDATVLELLGLFPARRRTIVVGASENPARVTRALALAALRGRRRVAFVTRGNALMYGRVPRELIRLCRKKGFACAATSSISMFEWVPALARGRDGRGAGLQVRNFYAIDRGFDPRLPLVVYFPAEREDPSKVARALAKAYPASHPCHVFAGAGGNELVETVLPLRRLARALASGDPGATLYIPPR